MSDHTRKIPCESCGQPATHLIWRLGLNLCEECVKVVKSGVRWERKR